jgi:hypothetical protein
LLSLVKRGFGVQPYQFRGMACPLISCTRLAPVVRPDAAAEGLIKPFSRPPPPSVSRLPLCGSLLHGSRLACLHVQRSPARPMGAPDLAGFVAPPPRACLPCSAPDMLLAVARRIGFAARSRSQLARRSPSTTKPATSNRITAEIEDDLGHDSCRQPNRLNLSGSSTGRSCRINHAAAGNRPQIEDRGFWKLPILPTTGRARSASPCTRPGDPPGHTQTANRARARLPSLPLGKAVYRAPGESPPTLAPARKGCVPGTGWQRGRAFGGSEGYRCPTDPLVLEIS